MVENKLQIPIYEKARGAELFKGGEYEEACKSYSKALLAFDFLLKQQMFDSEEQLKQYVDEIQLPCLLNLAACYIKLGCGYESVISHCNEALRIAPGNVKALYRRALAYTHLEDFKLAGTDLIAAAKEEPNNESIKQAWEELKKKRKRYKEKLKRIAQASFPVEIPPSKTWLELVKGFVLVCRSRFS